MESEVKSVKSLRCTSMKLALSTSTSRFQMTFKGAIIFDVITDTCGRTKSFINSTEI